MQTPQKSHWKDTMPKLQVCAWTCWRSTKSLCLQKRVTPFVKIAKTKFAPLHVVQWVQAQTLQFSIYWKICLPTVLISKMDVNRFLQILKIMKITIEVVFIEKSIVQAFFVKVKCSYSKICLIMWPFFTQKNIWMTSSNPLKISLTLLMDIFLTVMTINRSANLTFLIRGFLSNWWQLMDLYFMQLLEL